MGNLDDMVRLAGTQTGLIATGQLRELGISKGRQHGLVSIGVLEPMRRGVLRWVGSPRCWAQDLMAAILTPGERVVASHRSALRLWGLRTRFDGLEVTVRYPANRHIEGVKVHRSVDLEARDVILHRGIPVTNVARTLCDAGLIFPSHEVARMVDHAVGSGLTTPRDLLAFRERVGEHGRNGVVKLDEAVEYLPEGVTVADSGPEIGLLRLLLRAGLPEPELQYWVRANGRDYRLDLAYPECRLGLEYDGMAAHTGADAFVSDRRRQNDLLDAGWVLRRYTARDLRDRPEATVAGIRRHLVNAGVIAQGN